MVKQGVNGYLVKPFQEDNIVKTLDKVAGRMRAKKS
jgi:YesN/AraC family two-component response regulator